MRCACPSFWKIVRFGCPNPFCSSGIFDDLAGRIPRYIGTLVLEDPGVGDFR